MIPVNWPAGVNTKFFSLKRKAKDNVVLSTMVGGRVVGFKINEQDVFEIKLSIELSKLTTEADTFWNWFSNVLGGLAGYFTCSAIGNNVYRFTAVPDPQNTSQKSETLALSIEEVY